MFVGLLVENLYEDNIFYKALVSFIVGCFIYGIFYIANVIKIKNINEDPQQSKEYQTLYYNYKKGTIKYRGEFKDGKAHGQGTLYYKNGAIMYKGGYKENKEHGQGTLYDKDGTIKYEGEWINGEPIN